eukprot:TRINITY_DN4068_c0_g2_i3.p1 TRINITY_DN4068_c0_g2~~TRINITY_DN4068_c0_g2_i3.p1  ORF type:complete len:234 (+),score=39.64 TRINITY_DN4068_c0_g2_i3:240-941(+)
MHRIMKNNAPELHPFAKEREYVRTLNATKLDKVFAKPFVASLGGHLDGVYCMERHPQRLSCFVSGGFAGEMKIWNIATRNCLGTIPAHSSIVRGVCFSNDGGFFFSAGDDKVVKQWSLDYDHLSEDEESSNVPFSTFFGQNAFCGIDHHKTKQMFATVGVKLDIWDHARKEPINSFEWGSETVNFVKFNPVECDIIASGAGDRSIALYDIRASTPIKKLILMVEITSTLLFPI